MKLPCFFLNYGTWSCFRFSKRFSVLPMKVLLFFHSCQIVIHLCFAGKALIDSFFFKIFFEFPEKKIPDALTSVLLTCWIQFVSFIPIQKLDNNQNACVNLMKQTCPICAQKRHEMHERCALCVLRAGSVIFGKTSFQIQKDGNRCQRSNVKMGKIRPFEIELFFS